jgi:hypothetical protein
MKKPNNRDLAILVISFVIGGLVGWCVKGLADSTKEPITIENPINEALKKRGDSLEAVVAFRDSLDVIKAKKEALSDSIVNKNHKILTKDYDKYKDLDVDARIRYFDSLISGNKMRR